MHIFSFTRFLVGCSCFMALTACSNNGKQGDSSAGTGKEFVIGVAAPFTGDSSEFGAQMKMGIELYKDQLNAAGGIDGRKLKLIYEDDAGKAEQAQTVATTLASNDEVLAVVGHYNSSCSLAGKSVYKQAKLVMFSPASTNVDVTKDSDFVFRNIFTDDFQGKSLAAYSGEILGKKNAAILYDNDDYGAGLKDSYKARAAEIGLNVTTELAYDKGAPDFRSQLTTIQGSQPAPDIILIAGLYTQAANIARQARDLGINTQLIGGDGVFSSQFTKLAGDAANGTYVSCPFLFDLGGDKAKKFAADFKEKYNKEADAWAALTYDDISMVCEGLKKNGFSREGVQEYLKSVNSPETAYDGVVGKTYFDEQGDCKRPVQMAQVKDGNFVAADKQLPMEGKADAPTAAAPAPAATPVAAATTPADAATSPAQ